MGEKKRETCQKTSVALLHFANRVGGGVGGEGVLDQRKEEEEEVLAVAVPGAGAPNESVRAS